MNAVEANFDGLVGPTHNYSGLSFGNVASRGSSRTVSNPREAALQGLAKMKKLADLGLPQGVFPPHERPSVGELRRRGFTGTDAQILEKVARDDPDLLAAVSSASAMWAANAATVSPSADTEDGRVHLTPANLARNRHRSIETDTTRRVLERVFPHETLFTVHAPLPDTLGDEGAANHTRLAPSHGSAGVELFVYGTGGRMEPVRYPGRQSVGASQAIVDRHQVAAAVIAQQSPAAVDAGVFHNDVIAVGNLSTLFLHEEAFVDQKAVLASLADLLDGELTVIEVPSDRVSVEEAVSTYLFNSQLVTVGERQILLVPSEVRDQAEVSAVVDDLASAGGPIDEVLDLDLRQSMRNGGGPACLRLRVVLSLDEIDAVLPSIWLTDALYRGLTDWVERNYRTELTHADLADPHLLEEGRRALDELTRLLGLASLYDFQF